MEELQSTDTSLDPQQCKQCGMLNPHSNHFCGGCGAALSADVANTMADLQHVIDSDPQFFQRIAQLLQQNQNMLYS